MPGSTGDVRALQFVIQFYCKDKNGKSKWYTGKGGKHNFNSEWVGWQMQAGAAIAPKDYSQVRIVLIAKGQPPFAKFTNFYLVREEFGQSYQYDGKKNVVSTTERSGQQAGIHRQDFLFDVAAEGGLLLLDQFWLELALPIPRYRACSKFSVKGHQM